MAIEARNVHENHLCPSCLLEHWTYVLTKYNSRFGLRFLDLPATLALLDAKARGEVAVGVLLFPITPTTPAVASMSRAPTSRGLF